MSFDRSNEAHANFIGNIMSKSQPNHPSSLQGLLRILISDRPLLYRTAFFQVLQALTFIPFTAGVGIFIDHVILKDRGWEWVLAYALINLAWWPVHMFFTVKAFAGSQMMVRTSVARLRRMSVDKLQSLNMSFFTRQGAGALSNKLTVDITRVENFLNNIANSTLVSFCIGLGTIGYLFILNYRLAILSLITVPVQILFIKLTRSKLKKLNLRVQKAGEGFSEKMVEFVSGMRLTKSFGNEQMVSSKIEENIDHLKVSGYEATVAARWMLMVLQMIQQYTPILIWCAGAFMYWRETVTMGELVAFVGLLVFVQQGFQALIGAYEQWLPARPCADSVFKILQSEEVENYHQPSLISKPLSGLIHFSEVSFKYPDSGEWALRDINISIQPGEHIGLVGETGAGKSTFLDLILGFYEPTEGTIQWDEYSLKDMGVLSLRRQAAIMGQDAFIWNDTILENIRFGRGNATFEEILVAAKKAQADRFIQRFEHQYNTICGERGSKLSGGQRQRISLARIFLRDPRFIVLDEPTSALDAETEKNLQKDLEILCNGRTTFTVAHRLATIKNVDRVLVFKEGFIVEDGPPAKLLENPESHYYQLHAAQEL